MHGLACFSVSKKKLKFSGYPCSSEFLTVAGLLSPDSSTHISPTPIQGRLHLTTYYFQLSKEFHTGNLHRFLNLYV